MAASQATVTPADVVIGFVPYEMILPIARYADGVRRNDWTERATKSMRGCPH
jgi:hypothetical protein